MYYGPKTVTNGLVLAVDAADKNSYIGSGTTWTDLSGNANTGTLTNGPTFSNLNGGCIVFDGTDDYVSMPMNTNTRLQNNYQTYSAYVYITSVGPNSNASLWGVGVNPTGWWILWSATSITLFIETSGTYINYSVSVTNALNTWMNITCVIDNVGRTMTVYKNGSLVGTSSQWPVFTPPNDVVELGSVRATGNTGDYIKGRVSNVLLYNRALSATEVLQNYNATKTRFGL
jgi:hypothetical protein